MNTTVATAGDRVEPMIWRLFLSLLIVVLLVVGILGLPPALGSLYQLRSQWPRSSAMALTTLCVLIASFRLYRRSGHIFKIQAVVLWLLTGPMFVCSAYSTYNSLSFVYFVRNMWSGYEKTCGKYYAIYDSSDIENAKKALHDVIQVSLAQRSKAKYYWRFNGIIAYAEARLAVIEELQGDKKEADRLFASATDHWVLGEVAFRQQMRKEGGVDMRSLDADPVQKPTPDQWREYVSLLDKNTKWKKPNNPTETNPAIAAPVEPGNHRRGVADGDR